MPEEAMLQEGFVHSSGLWPGPEHIGQCDGGHRWQYGGSSRFAIVVDVLDDLDYLYNFHHANRS